MVAVPEMNEWGAKVLCVEKNNFLNFGEHYEQYVPEFLQRIRRFCRLGGVSVPAVTLTRG